MEGLLRFSRLIKNMKRALPPYATVYQNFYSWRRSMGLARMASILCGIGSEMAGRFQNPTKAEIGTRLVKNVVVDRLYTDMEIQKRKAICA